MTATDIEPTTTLTVSPMLRSVLWASGSQMMAEPKALVEAAVGASNEDVTALRLAARHATKTSTGEHVIVVRTRLLDALIRLPAACVELIDVRERKVRTRHSPEDFVVAEAELREAVGRARAEAPADLT